MTKPNLTTCTPAQLRTLLIATGTPHEAMNLLIHTDGTLFMAPLIPFQNFYAYGPGKLQAYMRIDSSAVEDMAQLNDTVMGSYLATARSAIAEGAFFRID